MKETLRPQTSGQLALPVQLDDGATLANFFLPDNKKNLAALKTIEEDLNQSAYLWGGPGAGISHLLQAACQSASLATKQSIYLPLKDIRQAPADQVLAGLETMNLICLDDLDSVVDSTEWTEQLFHLFNRSVIAGSRLLFGAKMPPLNLDTSLADLKSRLSSLLVHKVEKLSDEETVQALIFRAHRRGIEMPATVAEYLLSRYSRKSSDQFAALDKLDKAALTEKRKLTVPFVKMVLEADNDG